MSIWNQLGKIDSTPERMKDIPFTQIDNVLNKAMVVKDFELFTSNSEKYSEATKDGVHVIVCDSDTDNPVDVRICTHARTIVQAFKTIKDQRLTIEDLPTMCIKRKKTEKGFSYTFE